MPNVNSHTDPKKLPNANSERDASEPHQASHESGAGKTPSIAEKSVFATPSQRLPIVSTPDLEPSTSKDQADSAKSTKLDAAKHAMTDGREQLGSAASAVVARVEGAAEQVKERGEDLLHSAAHQASELYDSAAETVHEVADSAEQMARVAGRSIRHASATSASFVSTHALPLTAVGLSLAWLTWSIRTQSSPSPRGMDVSYTPRNTRRVPALRAEEHRPLTRPYSQNDTDGTTTSPKLMGARAIDRDLGY